MHLWLLSFLAPLVIMLLAGITFGAGGDLSVFLFDIVMWGFFAGIPFLCLAVIAYLRLRKNAPAVTPRAFCTAAKGGLVAFGAVWFLAFALSLAEYSEIVLIGLLVGTSPILVGIAMVIGYCAGKGLDVSA